MKLIAIVLGINLALCIFALLSCAGLPVRVIEKTLKIGTRHLVHAGLEKYPDSFKVLATISLIACETTEDRDKAIQDAFSEIAATCLKDLDDPLFWVDFTDIVDLMGVSLSPTFKIEGLSPETQMILNDIVCEFGKGVKQ